MRCNDCVSTNTHVAFIERTKYGSAQIKIYKIGEVSKGKPIEVYETASRGCRGKVKKELEKYK